MPPESDPISQISPNDLVEAIESACIQLSGHVIRTPTIHLPWLDTPYREVWAKLDCQQHSGSFKYRGAFNALRTTPFQSIITASAGNHALATACAGKRLGKNISVIVPTTASELKVNRLIGDANITLLGRDLFEATTIAMERADSSSNDPECDLLYLSPYANLQVAAGAGTILVEAIEDAGNFDAVILPLGGGGLAAAVGSWCAIKSPSTQVICSHPQIFGRRFDSAHLISEQLCLPTSTTHADGLGVQLVERTPFAEILDHTLHAVVQVSESAITAAIGCVLRLQSLLVEGAAATTIAALLRENSLPKPCRGRILLLLTGGNISSSTVAKALVSDVSDSQIRQQLGLRNIIPAVERHGSTKMPHRAHGPDTEVVRSTATIWHTLVPRLGQSIQVLKEKWDRKEDLAQRLGLQSDSWSTAAFLGLLQQLVDLYASFDADVGRPGSLRLPFWVVEERYRLLLQLQSAAISLFERASAAHDQSKRDWFFDTSAQGASAPNYARYGSADLRHMELNTLDALGLGKNQPIELLFTSSGMAAYQVIEHYLIRHLASDDTIVLPPYIYFEAMEQLQTLNHIRIRYSETFAAEDIVATAEKYDARAVFVDPIANIVGLPTTDVRLFAQLVCSSSKWADRVVVIDGTLASGALNPYDWFQGLHAPSVIYYESASKYPQLGLDIQMAGILVYPRNLDETMRRLRRNTATTMYPRNASLFPPLDFSVYQERMFALTVNAETFYLRLKAEVSSIAEVVFPVDWRRFGWRHGGALVTIRFLGEGMNNKEGLEACMELILRAAEGFNIPLVKGVSFGFSTSRISAASSMAKDSDPFLRLCIGVEVDDVELLARAVSKGVQSYHTHFGGDLVE